MQKNIGACIVDRYIPLNPLTTGEEGYENGMDYEKICKMKTREGVSLLIISGVSATRTLLFGTPQDETKEPKWLVEKGPAVGLFLGCSSSVTSGAPWEDIKVLVEGLKYYGEHGRSCL